MKSTAFAAAVAAACAATVGWGEPYADPALLDVPWGHYSFIRQGWRGYLETVPAARFRDGLGAVWEQTPPHKSADEVAGELAWAGFARVRLEIPWGSVKWDETGLDEPSAVRITEILRALRAHHLRPLILLNSNHLQPCPLQWRGLSLQRAALAGDRSLTVSGDPATAFGSSATVMSLADGTHAGPMIVDDPQPASGNTQHVIRLSKPLARSLAAGEPLRIAILRYAPLYPVGTAEFERTAGGWLRYVELVAELVERSYGRTGFDVEIWNELTFGSAYLDINNYRDSPTAIPTPEFLHPGGSAWELARRTVQLLKRAHPNVQIIWGFSNTTFFHTPIPELPAQLDGQSYHPYGTGRRCYAELIRGRRELLLDAYVPSGCVVQPEGYAHAWQQTESLLRLLAPAARSAHPPGSGSFQHFITEHGFSPAEIGITDTTAAEQAKQDFLLRAPLLWLNKGLTALYVYDVYDPDGTRWGLLTANGEPGAGMRALHRLTARFAAAEPLAMPRQLTLEVLREGGRTGVLPGDPDGRYLAQEQAAALLPFQVDAHRFLLGAYVMTQDFPHRLEPQTYRVTIAGVHGRHAAVRYFSPAMDTFLPATVIAVTDDSITLRLALTSVPRLVELDESQDARGSGES